MPKVTLPVRSPNFVTGDGQEHKSWDEAIAHQLAVMLGHKPHGDGVLLGIARQIVKDRDAVMDLLAAAHVGPPPEAPAKTFRPSIVPEIGLLDDATQNRMLHAVNHCGRKAAR